MSVLSGIKSAINNAVARSGPRLLTVKEAWYLTPNMIRVTFAGPELEGFPEGREGGNCKLMLPEKNETKEEFSKRLTSGPKPPRRTFTVRKYNARTQELSIDFVAHGDNGPASSWATRAQPGDFLGFGGPSGPKVSHFDADWYLVAADPSAIPVAAQPVMFPAIAPQFTRMHLAAMNRLWHWQCDKQRIAVAVDQYGD